MGNEIVSSHFYLVRIFTSQQAAEVAAIFLPFILPTLCPSKDLCKQKSSSSQTLFVLTLKTRSLHALHPLHPSDSQALELRVCQGSDCVPSGSPFLVPVIVSWSKTPPETVFVESFSQVVSWGDGGDCVMDHHTPFARLLRFRRNLRALFGLLCRQMADFPSEVSSFLGRRAPGRTTGYSLKVAFGFSSCNEHVTSCSGNE